VIATENLFQHIPYSGGLHGQRPLLRRTAAHWRSAHSRRPHTRRTTEATTWGWRHSAARRRSKTAAWGRTWRTAKPAARRRGWWGHAARRRWRFHK
jgi:hypothetical protein